MERQMLYSNVQQVEVFGRVAVTDDEAHKYYDAHMNEFTTPSSIMLREILVTIPTDARGVNAAADEAAADSATTDGGRATSTGGTFPVPPLDLPHYHGTGVTPAVVGGPVAPGSAGEATVADTAKEVSSSA